MTLASLVRRWAPILVVGLVVPAAWSFLGASLGDERLATTSGALLIVGAPGDTIDRFSPQEPVLNVTVLEVLALGPADDVQAGDVLEVVVPASAYGSEEVRAAFEDPVRIALRPAEIGEAGSSNATWSGWAVQDATRGQAWGLQRQVLGGAVLNVVPSVGGALLVGYAIGMPGERRRPSIVPDAPGIVAGLGWGTVLAASLVGASSFLFKGAGPDHVAPAVAAYMLVIVVLAASALAQPVTPRAGGTIAIVTGVGLLVAPVVGLTLLWGPTVDGRFGLGQLNTFAAALGAVGALGVVAARTLQLRATRYVAAAAVVGPVIYIWAWTPGDTLALLLAPLAAVIALDLVRPRWLVRLAVEE